MYSSPEIFQLPLHNNWIPTASQCKSSNSLRKFILNGKEISDFRKEPGRPFAFLAKILLPQEFWVVFSQGTARD
ncbi:hypothetical protein [Corynebacterium phoceense]|uniref:hypothetical protein n=1 Tax=Corynebacterium phoceense TaxID=1686286 RepID=UPI0011464D87|nr:hypothetical protein [Corynebacterium phoceense]